MSKPHVPPAPANGVGAVATAAARPSGPARKPPLIEPGDLLQPDEHQPQRILTVDPQTGTWTAWDHADVTVDPKTQFWSLGPDAVAVNVLFADGRVALPDEGPAALAESA